MSVAPPTPAASSSLAAIVALHRPPGRAQNVVMSAVKIIAILLIVAGIAGLLYGRFTYTKETHEVDLGPVELAVKEKRTVNIPLWAGIAAILTGVVLLVVRGRSRASS